MHGEKRPRDLSYARDTSAVGLREPFECELLITKDMTLKGKTTGITRCEFEYPIPLEEANILLNRLCEQPILEKIRYLVDYKGFTWEVDEFLGDNAGLLIAEIELEAEDQSFAKPEWVGEEVSGDARYFNSSLSRNPFIHWKK